MVNAPSVQGFSGGVLVACHPNGWGLSMLMADNQ